MNEYIIIPIHLHNKMAVPTCFQFSSLLQNEKEKTDTCINAAIVIITSNRNKNRIYVMEFD